MSLGAYAPDKAAYHLTRLVALKAGKPIYPVHLHLIPSDYCQLSCPGCSYRSSGFRSTEMYRGPKGEQNPRRFLDWGVLRSVIADCDAMDTRGIEITGGGETTLHPRITDLLKLALNRGLHTALITNGLTLSLEKNKELVGLAVHGDWVRVSIDAATRDTYNLVRPPVRSDRAGNRNFEKALEGLQALAETKQKHHLTSCVIGAGFVVQKGNWHEIVKAAALYKKAGADNIRISGLFSPWGERYFDGWREQAEGLEKAAIRDLDDPTGYRVYGRFHEKVADLHASPTYKDCWYQRFTLYLGADGNLYRCCVTSYQKLGLLGNIIQAGGLKALLDKPETQEKIRSFDARQCPVCQFNDRNKAIQAMIDAPELPQVSPHIVHPWFV